MCGKINLEILEAVFLYLSLSISKMSVVLINQKILVGILGSVPLKPGWREHHDCCLLAETPMNCLEKKFSSVGKDLLGLLPGGVTTAQE